MAVARELLPCMHVVGDMFAMFPQVIAQIRNLEVDKSPFCRGDDAILDELVAIHAHLLWSIAHASRDIGS
ncbi:hypothetical protein BIFGAL_03941 [Bifidobacterium gallicum DSM 20093 = LMG 11596]|uniref:Uncharacterized protein n=1 Tax=Bifidobacterium gallicum DSM 20093 = LMG 11596 TaxID=561180 RepID=D1NVP9_9BIFI|nr:hypothetical protein BIFGAL_03941 [Bifidobacterium gallicum DSM 20093 = LMG 11596]